VQVASAVSGSAVVGSVKRETAEPRGSAGATTKRAQKPAPVGTASAADAKTVDSNKNTKTKPQTTDLQKTASAEAEAKSASTASLLSGAAPTVPTGTFGLR
jgi:hypothetical protein